MATYELQDDIELVCELLGISVRTLSADLDISRMTLNRWVKNPEQATRSKLETFYAYAFNKGIHLGEIHAQLFEEETYARGLVPLFHGSKRGIVGELSTDCSRSDNDFGKGFYCGESFKQSALFVARYPESICYQVAFDVAGLRDKQFKVNNEWMLAIAFYRGKLAGYEGHPLLQAICCAVEQADYVVAPIADNRIFQIIDEFVEGEITDAQCEHSLSATHLGCQYVLRSDESLQHVKVMRPQYLCKPQKQLYLTQQKEQAKTGNDKSKAARRQYRGQGRYIEELLQ